MAAVTHACVERGLLPLVLGNRVHVAPPLNTRDADVESGIATLGEALAEADTFVPQGRLALA